MKQLIIGMSGASGSIYGIRLLQILKTADEVETHLVMSPYAKQIIEIETSYSAQYVEQLADFVHGIRDQASSISSGSYRTDGMIIAPCSIKTLSAIANSYADNLLVRAADVTLKEQRKLVLMPRETPLHAGHCKLLYEAAQLGAVIAPPIPAFYDKPVTIDDQVNHSVGRVLDQFGVDLGIVKRWQGKQRHADSIETESIPESERVTEALTVE